MDLYVWTSLATLVFTSLTSMGGIGGAFILVPVLFWLGIPLYEAEALGLLAGFFTMVSASVQYHRGGYIRYRTAWALIVGMLIFSPPASYVSAVVNKNIVLLVFFLFLLLGGSMMFFYRSGRALPKAGNSKTDYLPGFLAGTAAGFLSGLLGVGGGILIGPFLIWRGFAGREASGTSSFVVVFSALAGFLGHLDFMGYAHVHADYLLFGLVVAAGSAGGLAGSCLARFKLSTAQIRKIIGAFEYAMAARIMSALLAAL